ncbi:hypothetical protein D915_010518 [Fasciola hepatica]|uniref:PB1 domain-containing protein n=1 Tax=Fasciola hepatica TaxID=6192 RepID=A0A4E0R9Z4_FASHE|nr:hypothetical protein D915_010518 [Fasciola hepatica]
MVSSVPMSARIVKFKYGSDIRRTAMDRRSLNFDELKRVVHDLYKDRISDNLELKFKYIDGDGDMVTVSNDMDLDLALDSVPNIKFLVYPSYCKEESDPCAAIKKRYSLSQLEAVNIAQQLVVMRALILKIINRITSEDKQNLLPSRLVTSETTSAPTSQSSGRMSEKQCGAELVLSTKGFNRASWAEKPTIPLVDSNLQLSATRYSANLVTDSTSYTTVPACAPVENILSYSDSQIGICSATEKRPVTKDPFSNAAVVQIPSEHTADVTQLPTVKTRTESFYEEKQVRAERRSTEQSGLLHLIKEDRLHSKNIPGSPIVVSSRNWSFAGQTSQENIPGDSKSVLDDDKSLRNQLMEGKISWKSHTKVMLIQAVLVFVHHQKSALPGQQVILATEMRTSGLSESRYLRMTPKN